ncbi:MAG: hypothetical protein Kow0022_10470 [Phycisphaerales bacterium]
MSEHQVDLKSILAKAGGYAPEAYRFISDGLAHTVATVHGEEAVRQSAAVDDDSLHVSGQQLCLGLRDYALQRYGLLARTVLRKWNIHSTEDFGRIVFALVESGLMRKTEDDRIEDFQGVYDFDEEFIEPAHTTDDSALPSERS